MQAIIETFVQGRKVSTPIFSICSADQRATMAALSEAAGDVPRLSQDCVRGLVGLNSKGNAAIAGLGPIDEVKASTKYLADALALAAKLPADSILFVLNAQNFLNDPAVRQGIANLRDLFKQNGRTLVLLGPEFKLPPELQPDVVPLDEPLPGTKELGDILDRIYESVKKPLPSPEVKARAIETVRGLSAFAAEQVFALCMTLKNGVDLEAAWDRKRQAVNQTPGLTMYRSKIGFADLGGLASAKEFGSALFGGPAPIKCVLFIDEIEKQIAGVKGDLSGVAQNHLGQILQWMEDHGVTGFLFMGPPGCAKSAFAQALATEGGVPLLRGELGGTKDSLMGASEKGMGQLLKIVNGVGSDGVLVVATCNDLTVIPPEMLRRFRLGIIYFDLPTREEQEPIWNIHLKAYGLAPELERPDYTGWTGAEIRNCCELAWRLGPEMIRKGKWQAAKLLVEAGRKIVPTCKSRPQQIADLRAAAVGRWLSASYEGAYQGPQEEAAPEGGRRMAVN